MKRFTFAVPGLCVFVGVALVACGKPPTDKLFSRAEQVASRGEALAGAISAIPAGDEDAAKSAAPQIANLYQLYAQAIRERTDAAYLAGPLKLSIDQRVGEAKLMERLKDMSRSLVSAAGRLTRAQQAAIWTAEVQVYDAQCQRWSQDPWYLKSYELLGECEDLQRLGKPCEWAEAMVMLGTEISLESIAADIRRAHDAGYESAAWAAAATTSEEMMLTCGAVRSKLVPRINAQRLSFKPNAAAPTWPDWIEKVKRDCPRGYERLKVSSMTLEDR